MKVVWEQWENQPIRRGEMHIWRRSLRIDPAQQAIDLAILTEDEQKRAKRYYFEKHRRRFIAARAGLRHILSFYLGISPVQIGFDYTPYGKPEIAESMNQDMVRFNVSHSGDLALYALLNSYDVGIDVEKISQHATEGIAKRFFAKDEYEALMQLAEDKREEAFFRIWTQKEALIKAIGEGLSYPLDKFTVNVVAPAKLLTIESDDVSAWCLQEIQLEAGYYGAVAIRHKKVKVRYFRFN